MGPASSGAVRSPAPTRRMPRLEFNRLIVQRRPSAKLLFRRQTGSISRSMKTAAFAPVRLPLMEVLRVLCPSLVAVALFVVAFFGVLLPAAERNLMGQKHAMITDLTRA